MTLDSRVSPPTKQCKKVVEVHLERHLYMYDRPCEIIVGRQSPVTVVVTKLSNLYLHFEPGQ
jgi:hypothetical protein